MMSVRLPEGNINPAKRCIYCGVTEYFPGSSQPLHREHIIAEALNGEMVFPEASCRRCERVINPWETRLMRGALLGCKTYLGLATKKPKERPEKLALFNAEVKPEPKILIPVKDYPVSIILPIFDTPRIYNPTPMNVSSDGAWHHIFQDTRSVLKSKYGLRVYATPSIDTFALCRTLAKTAHAYAAAKLGLDGFKPLLPNFIIGQHDTWRLHYIGGVYANVPPTNDLHSIEIEKPTIETWRHVVVRIRFFARYGAPIYRIVTGERNNPIKPIELLLAEANAAHMGNKVSTTEELSYPVPVGLWDPDAPSSLEAHGPEVPRWIRAQIEIQ